MRIAKYIRDARGLALWLPVIAGCSYAQAGNIYRWTDAQGQTHYSDTPRGAQVQLPARLPTDKPSPASGLRAGERAGLRDIERRRQQRHRQAETARRRVRLLRDNHRQTCHDRREQQRRGRRHVDGKAVSRYLRAHCW